MDGFSIYLILDALPISVNDRKRDRETERYGSRDRDRDTGAEVKRDTDKWGEIEREIQGQR